MPEDWNGLGLEEGQFGCYSSILWPIPEIADADSILLCNLLGFEEFKCHWDTETPAGEASCFGTQQSPRLTDPLNSTVNSSQALTRPNWSLEEDPELEERAEQDPELEELAEASLLQEHQEVGAQEELIESEAEAASAVEARDPVGGGQVEPQPVPGQQEAAAAGDHSGGGLVAPLPMQVQQEAGAVGGAKQKVPQMTAGDSSLNHTNFPPPEFCSGCGFIGEII